MTLLYAEDTPYQSLAVYEHDVLGRVLVFDGIVQTIQADEFIYHEMFTYLPMLGSAPVADSAGAEVLIIGGGDGGILREVLRHSHVRRAVSVELDEAVIRVCREYLGINGNYDDPRVTLIIGKGMDYVQNDEARFRPFDLIPVYSTDPTGPGEILYSPEFYRCLKACLKPHGVVVRLIGLPPIQRDIFASGVERLYSVFENVQVYRTTIPSYIGGKLAFAAATGDGHSLHDPQKPFQGRYHNPQVHRAAFALPTFWREIVEDRTGAGGTG